MSLQASNKLSRLQVPDVDLTASATRVEEGSVESDRQDRLAFLSAIVKREKEINGASTIRIHSPQVNSAVSTSRDQDLVTGSIRHNTLCQHHTIDISIVRKVFDVVPINLQDITSSSMPRRKALVRRSGSPDTARPSRVKEGVFSQRGMIVQLWLWSVVLLFQVIPLDGCVLCAEVDSSQQRRVGDTKDIAGIVARVQRVDVMVRFQVPDVGDAVGSGGEEKVLIWADAEVEDTTLVGFEQGDAVVRVERVDEDLAALRASKDGVVREGESEDRGIMA
jgi:hypothetical protein